MLIVEIKIVCLCYYEIIVLK